MCWPGPCIELQICNDIPPDPTLCTLLNLVVYIILKHITRVLIYSHILLHGGSLETSKLRQRINGYLINHLTYKEIFEMIKMTEKLQLIVIAQIHKLVNAI